jgi:hypothetical protein
MIATTLVKLIRSLALMIVLGSISPANSEIDFKDYRDLKNTPAFKTYLNGVGVGYSWANTMLNQRGLPLLYCQPGKLALGADNYADILQREITNRSSIKPDDPVETLLLFG